MTALLRPRRLPGRHRVTPPDVSVLLTPDPFTDTTPQSWVLVCREWAAAARPPHLRPPAPARLAVLRADVAIAADSAAAAAGAARLAAALAELLGPVLAGWRDPP